ncbi:MAG: site-specific integrase, partial [Bacteroidota bacterium]
MGQNDKQSIVFMEHLKYERRLSTHTLKAYETDLQQFELFLKEIYEQESSSQADALQIRAWIVELLSKNISANSIHRKLATLKAYFKYLKLQGVVEDSPMVKVIAPRKGKRLPTFIPEERLEQLFDAIHFSEDYTSQRNRL